MKPLLFLLSLAGLVLLAAWLSPDPTLSAGTETPGARTVPTPACELPAWHTLQRPPANNLKSIAALADDDVWIGGDRMMHWDGRNFQAVAFPTPVGAGRAGLYTLSPDSATSIWAGGSYFIDYEVYKNLIEHWDGTQWTILPVTGPTNSAPTAATSSISDVAAVGAMDAFVVSTGVLTPTLYPGFFHCGTTACEGIPTDLTGYLTQVSALSTSDVWLIGDDPLAGYHFLRRWTGSPTTTLMLTSSMGLFDVAAVAADDVWVIEGTDPATRQPHMRHWDGTTWTTPPIPNIDLLHGVVARTNDDVWAYGTGVLHWDGSAWTQVSGRRLPGLPQSAFWPQMMYGQSARSVFGMN